MLRGRHLPSRKRMVSTYVLRVAFPALQELTRSNNWNTWRLAKNLITRTLPSFSLRTPSATLWFARSIIFKEISYSTAERLKMRAAKNKSVAVATNKKVVAAAKPTTAVAIIDMTSDIEGKAHAGTVSMAAILLLRLASVPPPTPLPPPWTNSPEKTFFAKSNTCMHAQKRDTIGSCMLASNRIMDLKHGRGHSGFSHDHT